MKQYILKIKAAKNSTLLLNCLLLFIFLYSYKLDTGSSALQFILYLIPLALLLIDGNSGRKPLIWVLILLILMLDLFRDYHSAANHHFVLIYLCATLLLATLHSSKTAIIIRKNSQYILALILLFAALQKLVSYEFVDGSYLSFLGLNGSLMKPLLHFEHYDTLMHHNREAVETLRQSNPMEYNSVVLKAPITGYASILKFFSYFTIGAEALIGVLLLASQHRFANSLLVLFLGSLLFIRNETGFIAILSLLAIGQLYKVSTNFKIGYFLIYLASIVLMLTRNGYF